MSVSAATAVRRRRLVGVALASVLALVATILCGQQSRASAVQSPIDLGTVATYSVLASSSVTNNATDANRSVYPGNVGVSPGNGMVGMDSATVGGRVDIANDAAAQAHTDLTAAYIQAKGLTSTATIDGDLAGRTITPGIYFAAGAIAVTKDITFDAQGNPDAYFIFQIDAAVNTAAGTSMLLANGAQSSHIFWQINGAATLGGGSLFIGTMLGDAAITIGVGTNLTGRVLTYGGAITIAHTDVTAIFDDPKVDSVNATQGTAVSFNILTNDGATATGANFSLSRLSDFPQLVGNAVGPTPGSAGFGSVSCNYTGASRGVCTYQSIPSFTGVDGFDYALTQQSQQWNVHVTITVIANDHTPILRKDRVVATVGGQSVTLFPLDNDSSTDGAALAIASVAALPAVDGVLQCSTSSCTYSPPASGFVGTATTTYSVSDGANSTSATGVIEIFVDAAPMALSGFSSAPRTTAAVSIGNFVATSTISSATAACVSGRASSTITWQAAAGATTWDIERRIASSDSTPEAWGVISAVQGSVTSFVDTLVSAGQSYQWRVRPNLERWNGVYSAASSAITEPPAAPSGGC